jgi:hypothetical protein
MEQQRALNYTFAELAAAQLVEQLKNTDTSDLEIPITDSAGKWLVTAKLVKRN